MRPICCNHGCNKPVICSSGKISDPNPRYRPVCGHCQTASWKGIQYYAPGVVPFVTGVCSNKDKHLGFECWTNFKKMPADFKGRTQISNQVQNKKDFFGNWSNNVIAKLVPNGFTKFDFVKSISEDDSVVWLVDGDAEGVNGRYNNEYVFVFEFSTNFITFGLLVSK